MTESPLGSEGNGSELLRRLRQFEQHAGDAQQKETLGVWIVAMAAHALTAEVTALVGAVAEIITENGLVLPTEAGSGVAKDSR
jgi:hypothetical protein